MIINRREKMTSADNDESRLIGRNLSSNKGYVIPILFKDILRKKKVYVINLASKLSANRSLQNSYHTHTHKIN